jgi:ATP-binding cassette, subfamily B, bacterial PglK
MMARAQFLLRIVFSIGVVMALSTSTGSAPSILGNLGALYKMQPPKIRRRIGWMGVLQVVAAASEVVSLGAVIPFLGALANAQSLLEKEYLQPWLNRFDVHDPQGLVMLMAGLFTAAFLLSNVLRLVAMRGQLKLSADIGSLLSLGVYSNTLYQPYSYHTRHNSSDLISLSTWDSVRLSSVLLPSVFQFVTSLLVVVAVSGTLVFMEPEVALIAAGVIGTAYMAIYMKTREAISQNGQRISQLNAASVKAVQEGFGGIRDVLIDGSQAEFEAVYHQANSTALRAQSSNNFIGAMPRFLIEPIALGAIAALAVSMSTDMAELERVLPFLGALALGANRQLPALQQCFVAVASIRGCATSLAKVIKSLSLTVPGEKDVAGGDKSLPFTQEISVENVWFAYDQDGSGWTLEDVSIKIKAHSTVALIGTTGAGKSTMADLVLGLLRPQQGQILVDGEPLTDGNMRAWQAGIAHVPQHIYLSDATIAKNIAFGAKDGDVDMDRVREAAKQAQIADFIEGRPKAYDELVGERGIQLSGGQQQRIGIARALYKKASVIVFDEATSALDNDTEREVMSAIEGLSRDLTIIIIAHRLSTIKGADVVYKFSDGKVQRVSND